MPEKTMSELLALLPEMQGGVYFELRKQASEGEVEWCCAKLEMGTNREHCNNVARTPELAVTKMLQRLGAIPAEPINTGWQSVKTKHPAPHARYLLRRNGVIFTVTPCYGMHAPWWVIKTLEGEAEPIHFADTDEWSVLS